MKNQLMEAASKHNMTLNDYALYCIWEHIRSERGIPPPGQAQFALADPMAEIHAYITGEEILMPCGLRKCDIDLVEFQGMTFCDTCNVRVE